MSLLADAILRGRDPDAFAVIAEIAAAIPGRRPGKHASVRVVERWTLKGTRGHRLACSFVGSRRVIRWRDLAVFLNQIAKVDPLLPSLASDRAAVNNRDRRRAFAARAARVLLGVQEP